MVELAIEGDQSGSVRAVFDETYATLSEPEQRAFRLLSLVPGPSFTTDVAAAMIEAPRWEAEQVVRGLATAHLIDEQSFGRYTFHDLVRAFGLDRARRAGDGPHAATERLLGHYLHRAVAAAQMVSPERIRLPRPAFLGPVDTVPFADRQEALDWLSEERHNLVAGVHHAARYGPAASSWYLVDALRGFFWLNSPSVEWLGCAQAALAAARQHGAADGEAAVSLGIAQLLLHHDRHEESLQAYLECLTAMRAAGWIVGEATALSHIGNVHMHAGRLGTARDMQQQALDISLRQGLDRTEAFSLHALGRIECYAGDLTHARELVERSYVLCDDIGDRYGAIYALIDLAMIETELGRHQEAFVTLRRGFQQAAELGPPVLKVRCRSMLAHIHRSLGRDDEAAVHYERAVELARGINVKVHEAEAVIGLAAVTANRGDLAQATRHAETAMSICHRSGFGLLEADTHAVLAEIHSLGGSPGQSADHHGTALSMYEQSGYLLGRTRLLRMPHAANQLPAAIG